MSISRGERLIALLPMGYYWATRLRSWRDIAYMVVTSWLPPIWIAWAEGTGSLSYVATAFALGYLAFISAYEIGYVANDAWDARRHRDGRARGIAHVTPAWAVAFLTVRLLAWVGVGLATGWLRNPLWVTAYLVLALVFSAHNMLRQPALRLATFAQLAVLRFVLPVLAILSKGALAPMLVAALLAYLPLRYLAYADSKDLLVMPRRRDPWFGAYYLLLSLPLLTLIAWTMDSPALVEVGLFIAAAHGAWALGARQLKGAN